jgi:hypothetical protein
MPNALDQLPEFEAIRSSGMELAANLVLEHKYDLAKEIFAKLLEISPETGLFGSYFEDNATRRTSLLGLSC